jgi:transcriptional regulator with XRE-family HTH domain
MQTYYERRLSTDMNLVAERVLVLRRRRQWTQQQLAEKAGVTRQQVYLFETGKFPNIPAKALASIAQALDTTIEDLFRSENASDLYC